jgi:sulfoxide reductase catalytic subunit YedY
MRMAAAASVAAVFPEDIGAAPVLVLPRTHFNKTLSATELKTSYTNATGYNNYYEFDTSKQTPATLAEKFNPSPWTLTIDGEVKKPKVFDVDHLIKLAAIEERVYRLRCVEGWSMVLPWLGYPLSKLLSKVQPTSRAKYVEFTSLYDVEQMPNQLNHDLVWPYTEGLRLDEAMNSLTLLTFGLYGQLLPNQNGAPIRLVVPWKYGFKSPKAIVRIRFVNKPPTTSWMQASPTEYGFFPM